MRYILDELYAFEEGHPDAMHPSSAEDDLSFMGEERRKRTATIGDTEDIVAAAFEKVNSAIDVKIESKFKSGFETLQHGFQTGFGMLSSLLTNVTGNAGSATKSQSRVGLPSTSLAVQPTSTTPAPSHTNVHPTLSLFPIPSQPSLEPQPSTSGSSALPPGVRFPHLDPDQDPDEKWQQYIKDWHYSDPDRGHLTALKDWDPKWYRGREQAANGMSMNYHKTLVEEFEIG